MNWEDWEVNQENRIWRSLTSMEILQEMMMIMNRRDITDIIDMHSYIKTFYIILSINPNCASCLIAYKIHLSEKNAGSQAGQADMAGDNHDARTSPVKSPS